MSIKWPGKKAVYYAWGHPIGNNCSWGKAEAELKRAWAHPDGVLFHNGKFDEDVAEVHFGLPILPWNKLHDTMLMLFLDDPHQAKLGLKESADRLLGTPPTERDAVAEWLTTNQPIPGVKISRSPKSDHYFGKYIALAPGTLVGPYANGDTDRTGGLFDLLWPRISKTHMGDAYDRDRRLLPILLEMERDGVPVDLRRLTTDTALYRRTLVQINLWLLDRLRVPKDDRPETNLDSSDQLVALLAAVGKIDLDVLGRTDPSKAHPEGQYRSDKDSFMAAITDAQMASLLSYRASLCTCLRTFMEPWLQVAQDSGGRIFTQWHQTRTTKDKGIFGTRTGRLSSTPNFQNIPKEFSPFWKHEIDQLIDDLDKSDKKAYEKRLKELTTLRKTLPAVPFDLPPLPKVRSYIIAEDGHILVDRDYSQQELRILGHFEGAVLMQRYLENPRMDVHNTARDMINNMLGTNYDRKPIKNTGFGLIYGMGLGKLATDSNITVEEAKRVRDAYLAIFPGLKDMYKDMKVRAKEHVPIRTWGGRLYYCEEPKLVDGRLRTFDYKMLNVLIQGSAADCTKEAVIRFHAMKKPNWKILLTVHDEILVSAPVEEAAACHKVLRQAMESVEFDVPMLSDGTTGPNAGDLKELEA